MLEKEGHYILDLVSLAIGFLGQVLDVTGTVWVLSLLNGDLGGHLI